MSCSVDKGTSLGFSWKFNLHPLLVNHVAWGRWKTLVHGLSPASERWIISGYPHPALSQFRFTCVSASICWEREVLLQVGAVGRPNLQASFPSPASVSQVKSETSRWGGESKGWGMQNAIMSWDRYKLSDLKTDNPDIQYVLFWSNSLRSFQLLSSLRVFISLFLISIGHFYFFTLGHYHFAITITQP